MAYSKYAGLVISLISRGVWENYKAPQGHHGELDQLNELERDQESSKTAVDQRQSKALDQYARKPRQPIRALLDICALDPEGLSAPPAFVVRNATHGQAATSDRSAPRKPTCVRRSAEQPLRSQSINAKQREDEDGRYDDEEEVPRSDGTGRALIVSGALILGDAADNE